MYLLNVEVVLGPNILIYKSSLIHFIIKCLNSNGLKLLWNLPYELLHNQHNL